MVSVRIRWLPHGEGLPAPVYATSDAAGADLCAAEDVVIDAGRWKLVSCGFCLALPAGFEAQVRPRSGLAVKHGVTVLNAPGTIDADYRGEVRVALVNHGAEPFHVRRGERIAQLVVAPVVHADFAAVDSLDATDRGDGGFGSTGR